MRKFIYCLSLWCCSFLWHKTSDAQISSTSSSSTTCPVLVTIPDLSIMYFVSIETSDGIVERHKFVKYE